MNLMKTIERLGTSLNYQVKPQTALEELEPSK
jgi:hypothetical protein